MAKKSGEFDYEKSVAKHPILGKVVKKESWDYLTGSNQFTVDKYIKEWKENLVKNVRCGLWKKHRSLAKDCIGLCMN